MLPKGAAPGEVVALELDAATGRLLKAHPHALYESTDGGESWTPVPLPERVREGTVASVAVPVDSSAVLYVAGPGIGVLRSADSGRSWTRRTGGLPEGADIRAVAAHATQGGTLYAFTEGHGVYRTEDAGETWTKMDGGPGAPVCALFHSNMKGSMQTGWLFTATPEGVRRSMDCFCGWRPTGKLPTGEILDVAHDPRRPERVYAATASGLFRSEDGGETWQAVTGAGLVPAALAVDAAGVLYGTDPSGVLHRSADDGASWKRIGA